MRTQAKKETNRNSGKPSGDQPENYLQKGTAKKRDKIEGTNGGELGDPDMYAELNIEVLRTRIGYRNVMSR